MSARGFWGVAVACPKYGVNTGSLWRTAQIMGADLLVLVSPGIRGEMHRQRLLKSVAGTRRDFSFAALPGLKQSSDTVSAHRHMPVICVEDPGDLRATIPTARIVGLECPDVAEKYGRESAALRAYQHYDRAIYLLGAEDYGLRKADVEACDDLVYIESALPHSLNVACAGTVLCADRFAKKSRKLALRGAA